MGKPKLGKIYESNDKLFTGYKKKRHVVVSKEYKQKDKFGLSRILSLSGKEGKKDTLLPIKQYECLKEPSGIDYSVYTKVRGKNGKRENINFGSMKDTGVCLDKEDTERMKKHIKPRGGQSLKNKKRYKKFKRKK